MSELLTICQRLHMMADVESHVEKSAEFRKLAHAIQKEHDEMIILKDLVKSYETIQVETVEESNHVLDELKHEIAEIRTMLSIIQSTLALLQQSSYPIPPVPVYVPSFGPIWDNLTNGPAVANGTGNPPLNGNLISEINGNANCGVGPVTK